MAFDKDNLLKEEYKKVEAMAKKSKKKKKNKQKGRTQQKQVEERKVTKNAQEANIDEEGMIILEEEKNTSMTELSSSPAEPAKVILKYGRTIYNYRGIFTRMLGFCT